MIWKNLEPTNCKKDYSTHALAQTIHIFITEVREQPFNIKRK